MEKIYFPKRIAEPKSMEKVEFDVFEKNSRENYKRWIIPLVDDVLASVKSKDKNLKILDLACGPGFLAGEIARRSNKFLVFGLDNSRYAIKLAKKNCNNLDNVILKVGDVIKTPFPEGYFDVIVCKDSLHHFSKLREALEEMVRITKKGGMIYIQDLRRNLPWHLLRMAIPPDTVFKKLQYYSARAAYTTEELSAILGKMDLKGINIRTRKISKDLEKRYGKEGIDIKLLRAAFQSRYVAILRI